MKKIGITGGIGSGKTTVSKIFSVLGVAVYNADERAKYLLNYDVDVIKKVKEIFGDEIYFENKINRKRLSALVFNQTDLLKKLNGIVHPAVFDDFDKWCATQKNQPYILKEAALIFETIIHQRLDKIIVIAAPEKIKIERVMRRDNISAQQVQSRMNSQFSEEEKLQRADFIIYNDEQQLVMPQVLLLHQKLMQQ